MAKAKKKTAKKPAAKKAPAKKSAANKSAPKKAAAKKAAAKKPAPKMKAAPAKAPAAKPALRLVSKIDLSNVVTPLDDRVLVRLTDAERKTAGGLFIPDTVSDVSGNLQGLVVAVGRGHRNKKGQLRPLDVRIGDRVVFPEYSGSKIRVQNEDLVILRESEVMGVIA